MEGLPEKNAIIGATVASHPLEEVLREIYSILSAQNESITKIQNQISSVKKDDDSESLYTSLEHRIAALEQSHKESIELSEKEFHELNDRIESVSNEANESSKRQNDELTAEIAKKIEDIEGTILINSEQIRRLETSQKNIQTQNESNKEAVRELTIRIDGKDVVEENPIPKRVENLEERLDSLIEENDKKFNNQINELREMISRKEKADEEKDAQINKEVKSLRRLIVDTPEIQLDGVTDTGAIVRAIQRDSRRIDSFNETILNLKEDHNKTKELIKTIAAGFEQIQLHLQKLVAEFNSTRRVLYQRTSTLSHQIEKTAEDIIKTDRSLGILIEMTSSSMQTISNVFQQLFSFLSLITTRPIPSFPTIDDDLIDFKKFQESQATEHRRLEEKKFDLLPEDIPEDFELPFISVDVDTDKTPLSEKQQNKGVDMELRVDFERLKAKTEEAIANLNGFVETVNPALEKKADAVSTERLLERVTAKVKSLNDAVHNLQNTLSCFVQRDELNTIIETGTLSGFGDTTAAGSQGVKCLVCGRNRLSITGADGLPPLGANPQASYDLIYGTNKKSSSKISTRASLPR